MNKTASKKVDNQATATAVAIAKLTKNKILLSKKTDCVQLIWAMSKITGNDDDDSRNLLVKGKKAAQIISEFILNVTEDAMGEYYGPTEDNNYLIQVDMIEWAKGKKNNNVGMEKDKITPAEEKFMMYKKGLTGSAITSLIDLIFKLDTENRAKLALGFPELVEVVNRYKTEEGYWYYLVKRWNEQFNDNIIP